MSKHEAMAPRADAPKQQFIIYHLLSSLLKNRIFSSISLASTDILLLTFACSLRVGSFPYIDTARSAGIRHQRRCRTARRRHI